jgi:hypothetical protein
LKKKVYSLYKCIRKVNKQFFNVYTLNRNNLYKNLLIDEYNLFNLININYEKNENNNNNIENNENNKIKNNNNNKINNKNNKINNNKENYNKENYYQKIYFILFSNKIVNLEVNLQYFLKLSRKINKNDNRLKNMKNNLINDLDYYNELNYKNYFNLSKYKIYLNNNDNNINNINNNNNNNIINNNLNNKNNNENEKEFLKKKQFLIFKSFIFSYNEENIKITYTDEKEIYDGDNYNETIYENIIYIIGLNGNFIKIQLLCKYTIHDQKDDVKLKIDGINIDEGIKKLDELIESRIIKKLGYNLLSVDNIFEFLRKFIVNEYKLRDESKEIGYFNFKESIKDLLNYIY